MINKKRIAICLFGQTRTYQVINEVYKNLNENPHLEIDFFLLGIILKIRNHLNFSLLQNFLTLIL